MNRNDKFEKSKITKASTNKVVTNVYYDAFGIEKVRFQNANYADKTSISMGGSKSSKNYNGAPESRIFSLGRSGDKIFINMSRGKGKITETGAIAPDGSPDLKIGVGMTIDKFRSLMIFTHDAVNGYLPHMVNAIVRQCEAERQAAAENQQ